MKIQWHPSRHPQVQQRPPQQRLRWSRCRARSNATSSRPASTAVAACAWSPRLPLHAASTWARRSASNTSKHSELWSIRGTGRCLSRIGDAKMNAKSASGFGSANEEAAERPPGSVNEEAVERLLSSSVTSDCILVDPSLSLSLALSLRELFSHKSLNENVFILGRRPKVAEAVIPPTHNPDVRLNNPQIYSCVYTAKYVCGCTRGRSASWQRADARRRRSPGSENWNISPWTDTGTQTQQTSPRTSAGQGEAAAHARAARLTTSLTPLPSLHALLLRTLTRGGSRHAR